MSLRTIILAFTALVPFLTALPTTADAQAPMAAKSEIATPPDLFMPLNRTMFGFNEVVVDYVVNPAAWVLGKVTPGFVQTGAANFYENISEPEFMLTNLLAGYPGSAAVSVGRFAVNSTVGIGGLFDVATPIGLQRRPTEVSEAMCKVGIPPGPYMVLPLIGPTNIFSGGILGAALAAEWYALSLISTALAAADAVFDVSVSVASLRNARDVPSDPNDRYVRQQNEFWDYVKAGCGQAKEMKTATATGMNN